MNAQIQPTQLNPIYRLITHQKGQLDEYPALRIGLIAGAAVFGAAMLSVVAADITKQMLISMVPMFLSAASYVTCVGVPALSLVFAVVMVNRLLGDQSLSLMLITPLSAEKILVGLAEGLHYRLRYIRYIVLSLIPTSCVGVAVYVGYAMAGGGLCSLGTCSYLLYLVIGGFPALVEAMYLIMNFAIQFWSAMYIGPWIYLRTGQKAFFVSSILALVPVLAGFLFAYLSLSWQSVSSELSSRATFLGYIVLSPLLWYGAGRLARRDSIRLIENRAWF